MKVYWVLAMREAAAKARLMLTENHASPLVTSVSIMLTPQYATRCLASPPDSRSPAPR